MAHNASAPKWGAGTLSAMGRQGIKELRAAVMPDSNIAREAEMGTFGTLTPGEIAQQKTSEPVSPELAESDKHSILGEHMKELEAERAEPQAKEREREEPEMDHD